MKKKLLTMSLLAASLLGVSAQTQEKKEISLSELSKISILRENLVRNGMPYRMADERVRKAILDEQNASLRSRLATPSDSSIWVDRDPNSFANYHPVYHNYTPEQLVKKVLLSNPLAENAISNVKFKGFSWNETTGTWTADNRSLHYFENGQYLGIEKGLLLATGPALEAEGPNTSSGQMGSGTYVTGDPDLSKICSAVTSGSVLEFDFVPYVSRATFDFIFVSDEYGDFSNSHGVNDAFGFFVSKTNNPTDTINIARFPNDSLVTISNSNWGYRGCETKACYAANPADTTGYSAALIWNSTQNGYYVPDGSPIAVNPQWHIPNPADPGDGGAIMTYDGQTIKLQAVADNLTVGESYHLKLAICNKGDNAYGSAVFLSNLDIGSAGIKGTSEMRNSAFHWLGAGSNYGSAVDENGRQLPLSSYINQSIINKILAANNGTGDTTNYGGFVFASTNNCKDCDLKSVQLRSGEKPVYPYTTEDGNCIYKAELTYVGTGDARLSTVEGLWDDYLVLDSLFIGDRKIDSCYDATTGTAFSIYDYRWGKDIIKRDPLETSGTLYYKLKPLPLNLNGKVSGITNEVVNGTTSETLYLIGYSQFTTNVKYAPVTEASAGSLSLGLIGGSEFIRWKSIDGIDCDPDENEECRWRFLRDTITGKELPFSNWEILSLYDGYNPVPIIVQEPFSCRQDTIWIGGSGPVTLQRYIDIPYAAGVSTVPNVGKHFAEAHKDFAFYAKFNGEPITVQATGYYSHDTITLAGIYQEDGLYEGSYKYVIKQVTEPWNILFASGTTSAGEETSNSIISTSGVWANGNTLYINTNENAIVNIYTLTGSLFKQITTDGNDAIQLPRGFYIISINGVQYKIMIK